LPLESSSFQTSSSSSINHYFGIRNSRASSLQQKTQGQDPQTCTTSTTTHETTLNNAGNIINYTYQYSTNTSIDNSTSGELPTDYARENMLLDTKGKLQEMLDEIKKPPELPGGVNQNEPGPENENIQLADDLDRRSRVRE